jgi:hypothetical protein
MAVIIPTKSTFVWSPSPRADRAIRNCRRCARPGHPPQHAIATLQRVTVFTERFADVDAADGGAVVELGDHGIDLVDPPDEVGISRGRMPNSSTRVRLFGTDRFHARLDPVGDLFFAAG